MINNIIWLMPKGDLRNKQARIASIMKNIGYDYNQIHFYTVSDDILQIDKTKKTKTYSLDKKKAFQTKQDIDIFLDTFCKNAIVVINDLAVGKLLFPAKFDTSLQSMRGSILQYRGYTCFIIDDLAKLYIEERAGANSSCAKEQIIYFNDLKKLIRLVTNTQRKQVPFNYEVIDSVSKVKNTYNFREEDVVLLAIDIETANLIISSIALSFLLSTGQIKTIVIPFAYVNGSFWKEQEEVAIWQYLKTILESNIPKVFQNGMYDNAYLIVANIAVKNIIFDTQYAQHAMWASLPKNLSFLASIHCDNFLYWKDMVDVAGVPATAKGFDTYWEYNARDTYYTLYIAIYMMEEIICKPDLQKNFIQEFTLSYGILFKMAMHGMALDKTKQHEFISKSLQSYEDKLQDLRIATGIEGFNPNSSAQVCSFIYDILDGRSKARSADEKVLKQVMEQSPLLSYFIKLIWKTKKELSNISKYGVEKLKPLKGRFLYNLSCNTYTGRLSSSSHQFWCGTNVQNIPAKVRPLFVPDKGYCMVDIDYSKSDTWFVAYESQDEQMISNLTAGLDTHILHASHFFKIEYEVIKKAHKSKATIEERTVAKLRDAAKILGHGLNYQMGITTLRNNLGTEALLNAAKVMGYKNIGMWGETELLKFTKILSESFYVLYPRLRPWYVEIAQTCAENNFKATCYGGRTHRFLGNPMKDKSILRQLAAFYGQGGTAGNINNAMHKLFYEVKVHNMGAKYVAQVHDSIVFQLPLDNLELIDIILECMELPCTIHGKTFTVPCDAQMAGCWTKDGIPYNRDNKDWNWYKQEILRSNI